MLDFTRRGGLLALLSLRPDSLDGHPITTRTYTPGTLGEPQNHREEEVTQRDFLVAREGRRVGKRKQPSRTLTEKRVECVCGTQREHLSTISDQVSTKSENVDNFEIIEIINFFYNLIFVQIFARNVENVRSHGRNGGVGSTVCKRGWRGRSRQ